MLLRLSHRRWQWALNVTRLFFLTNHAYPGERRFYMRVGTWPGRSFRFGWRVADREEQQP